MKKATYTDPQTGQVFELKRENRYDHIAAIISIVYLLLTLAFFLWNLFDFWFRQYSLANLVGYRPTDRLSEPNFRLAVYAFIGGGLGGIINGIRSFLVWHAELFAFGQRFVWKYLVSPWLGATLALFVYALIRSGIALLGGDVVADADNIRQVFSIFALSMLAGYGSRDVAVWLDAQVRRIFKTTSAADTLEAEVPDLTGKSQDEADNLLATTGLALGNVAQEAQDDDSLVGKVIKQDPSPGATLTKSATVDIVIGVKKQG